MDDAVQILAFALLVGTAGYLFLLVFNSFRTAAVVARTAEQERAFFRARTAEIMARSRAEQGRTELSWNGFRKFEIAERREEVGGVCSFYLKPHDKRPLPPFLAGQFLTFKLDIPGQTKPVIRCYSLSDGPTPEYFRVTIKKIPPPRDKPELPPGLSSAYFHDQLQDGDILDVKAPSGHFYLDTTAQTPIVLIGGGVGITPVLSMLNTVVASASKREVWFFLGVRNKSEHMMKDHLEAVAREHENVHLCICYSEPTEQCVEGSDYHHAGHVSVDLFKTRLGSNNYAFYFCGPPPMMNALDEQLRAWGVPENRINYEAFGPATVKRLKEPVAEAGAQSDIQVTFTKSNKNVPWNASAGSLLDFAEENGVAIDFGCRAGNCGTCLTAIQSGDVDYVGTPGEMPEKGSCLVCLCVPKSNLELDA